MKLAHIKKSLLTILTVLSVSVAANNVKNNKIGGEAITHETGFRYSFDSKVLAEKRELLIHLPADYENSEKNYPVIYVLDGNGHFRHAISAITYLNAQNFMPEAILIGITNNRGTRGRDLGNGTAKFRDYIKNDVVTLVEENYRASEHKTIFGHSMAGAFVMRGFLEDPTQFDSHIAASPGMRKDVIDAYQKFFNKSDEKLQILQGKSLYFTMAGIAAEGTENVHIVNELDTILKHRAPAGLNWDYQPLVRHAHMTTPYATFYEGVTNTFTDYQAPKIANYKDYLKQGGMKGIENYYQKRAYKYQTAAEVPNRLVRRLGGILFNDNHKDEAFELLITNTKNHPDSIWAYNALARLYDQNEQPKKSLNTFEKALKLAKQQKSQGIGYLESEIKRVKK